MTKYKNGDYVAVRAKVMGSDDYTVMCSFKTPFSINSLTFTVPIDDIIAHYPEKIKVGDTVKDERLVVDHKYTVMAIHNEYAWVKPVENDKCFTVLLSAMVRV